jgi:hypothetical protein
MERTIDRAAGSEAGDELLTRLALVRLRRFAPMAAVPDESGSPIDRAAALEAGDELLARLALVRLRRFARVAAVAGESGSPL